LKDFKELIRKIALQGIKINSNIETLILEDYSDENRQKKDFGRHISVGYTASDVMKLTCIIRYNENTFGNFVKMGLQIKLEDLNLRVINDFAKELLNLCQCGIFKPFEGESNQIVSIPFSCSADNSKFLTQENSRFPLIAETFFIEDEKSRDYFSYSVNIELYNEKLVNEILKSIDKDYCLETRSEIIF
jgi:hypothetical protein